MRALLCGARGKPGLCWSDKPYGSIFGLIYVDSKGVNMSLGTILVVLLVLALVGVLPTWGYSSSWGYAPGGIVGLLLVVIIILALLGRI